MRISDLTFASVLALFSVFLLQNVQFELNPRETTLIIIKPDGMILKLREHIYERLENELGLVRVSELFNVTADMNQLHEHYHEHRDRVFYPSLLEFMRSGPISVSVWMGGPGTVSSVRQLVGATDPKGAGKETIRGQHATSNQRNIIHASDSAVSAAREISIWFGA